MTLEELIAYTNPNTVIELFDAKENESIGVYDGVDEVPVMLNVIAPIGDATDVDGMSFAFKETA